MARTFYDNLGLNEDIELDLSMLEATGTLLHDESKNHIVATQHKTAGTIVWDALAAGRYGIQLANQRILGSYINKQYLDAPAADTANLDFTSGDYSLAIWFRWIWDSYSQILFGKYAVDTCGWEVYLHKASGNCSLTVRHHHSGEATDRTASYSYGWEDDSTMWLFSCSRVGATCQHYLNGLPITTIVSAGGLIDPASSAARDLIIGKRFTGDQNYLYGHFHRPRAWSKALTVDEHRLLYRLGYP